MDFTGGVSIIKNFFSEYFMFFFLQNSSAFASNFAFFLLYIYQKVLKYVLIYLKQNIHNDTKDHLKQAY